MTFCTKFGAIETFFTETYRYKISEDWKTAKKIPSQRSSRERRAKEENQSLPRSPHNAGKAAGEKKERKGRDLDIYSDDLSLPLSLVISLVLPSSSSFLFLTICGWLGDRDGFESTSCEFESSFADASASRVESESASSSRVGKVRVSSQNTGFSTLLSKKDPNN